MVVAPDPFTAYLKRAAELFEAGDIVQAGQIWQAILKKRPGHEIARAGLYKVKLYFDARATQEGLAGRKPAPPAPGSTSPTGQDPEIAGLLEQGCALYDAGRVEDALAKWIQVLAKEPGNTLAQGYIQGARRSLAQAAPEPPAAPEPAQAEPVSEVEDGERLLRDGCTLFDMGQVEEAMRKWERLLAQEPGHPLAWTYLQDARKVLGLPPMEGGGRREAPRPDLAEPPSVPAAESQDELLDRLVREGVQLYDMGMAQEAIQKWRQALEVVPGHEDASGYLAMAQRDLGAEAARPAPEPRPREQVARSVSQGPAPVLLPKRVTHVELVSEEPAPVGERVPADPVAPPAALTTRSQKAREGLDLTELVRKISLPGWMASPAFILGVIAGLVILVFGAFYYLRYRKDKALGQAVAAFKADAVNPVARSSEIANLQQTPQEIQKEAQSALTDDPLVAYFRAAELVRLNPVDAACGQLLEQAKAGLAKVDPQPASLEDFEWDLHAGNLEAADRSITPLLAQNPQDAFLKGRAGRLYAAMARAYASREMWDQAEARLRRARAILPEDGAWSARILLLGHIQSLPRQDRAMWIQLLG